MSRRRTRFTPTPMLGGSSTQIPVGAVIKEPLSLHSPPEIPATFSVFDEIVVDGTFVDSFFWQIVEPNNEAEPGRRWSLRCRVYDGDGDGGDLRVWVNKEELYSPDPANAPDGVLFLEGTEPYLEETILPDAALFTVGAGTALLLQGIRSGAREPKAIYLEFVSEAGNSSGVIEVQVPRRYEGLDWDGRFNPDVPTSDGWFVAALRDAQAALLDAIGLSESGWANLIGRNPDGTINEKALSDKIIANHEIAERVFENEVFDSDFLSSGILNSVSNTRLFAAGSVPESVMANFLFANTAVIDRLFANNVFTQSVMTRLLTAGSIVADKLSVTVLSAITASLGVITTGRMRSAEGPGTEQGLFDIHLDDRVLTIKDETGQTRVQIGKLTGTTPGWGIAVFGPAGEVWLSTNPAHFVTADGSPLGDGAVGIRNLNSAEIWVDLLEAGVVNATDITVETLAAINANLGIVSAGFIHSGTTGGPAIRLNSTYTGTEPGAGGVAIQSRNAFIDLAATGSQLFMRHPLLELGIGQTAVQKKAFLGATRLVPWSHVSGGWSGNVGDYSYTTGNRVVSESTLDVELLGQFDLPVGVTIKEWHCVLHRTNSGAAVICELTEDNGTSSTNIGTSVTATHTSGLATYSRTGLSRVVPEGAFVSLMTRFSSHANGTATAGFAYAWVVYEMANFTQTR